MKLALATSAFLTLASPALAQSTLPPRMDLYKQVATASGFSLRDAWSAIFSDNRSAHDKMLVFARAKGTKAIEKELETEIKDQREKCEKERKRKLECAQQVDDLERQLSFVTTLKSKTKKNAQLSDYYALLVLGYSVRYEVLKDAFGEWEQSCSGSDKINSIECKSKFFEINVIYDLASNLAQAAFAKSQSEPYDSKKIEIKNGIARYEK